MFTDLGFTATNIISNGARQPSEWRGQLGDLQAAIQTLGTSLPLVALSGASLVLPGERVSGAGVEEGAGASAVAGTARADQQLAYFKVLPLLGPLLVLPGGRVSGAGMDDRSRGECSGRDSKSTWRTFQLNYPATCGA